MYGVQFRILVIVAMNIAVIGMGHRKFGVTSNVFLDLCIGSQLLILRNFISTYNLCNFFMCYIFIKLHFLKSSPGHLY